MGLGEEEAVVRPCGGQGGSCMLRGSMYYICPLTLLLQWEALPIPSLNRWAGVMPGRARSGRVTSCCPREERKSQGEGIPSPPSLSLLTPSYSPVIQESQRENRSVTYNPPSP